MGYPDLSNYTKYNYHILCIGVNLNRSSCHERFAEQLALEVGEWNCFANGNVLLLKGTEATKERIKETLKNLGLKSYDVLIVYYGGRGGRCRDQAPFDEDDGKDGAIISGDGKYILDDDLADWCQQSGAGIKILLISACYSGEFVHSGMNGGDFTGEGFAGITSGNETSSTSTYEGIGFFPYLWEMLSGIARGEDRIITLGELKTILRHKTITGKARRAISILMRGLVMALKI